MSLHDHTPRGQSERNCLDVELPHTPEKVWRALTEPALLSEWLLPILELPLMPGAKFQLQAPPQPGWDGAIHCQLLEVEPLKRITYTWVVGELQTVVTFTISPTATGTSLSLVHSGFGPEQKQNFAGARYGWKLMLNRLATLTLTA